MEYWFLCVLVTVFVHVIFQFQRCLCCSCSCTLYGYHPVVVKVVSNFLGCIQLSVPLAQYEREIYYFCTVNSTFGVFMPCMIFCVFPPHFHHHFHCRRLLLRCLWSTKERFHELTFGFVLLMCINHFNRTFSYIFTKATTLGALDDLLLF